MVAIGPDGMGTPLERLQGYYTLAAARGIAAALAPAADWLSRTPTGRTLFFAGNRSRPWQLTPGDAHQLLTGFARADAFHDTNRAGSIEIPTYLHRIRQPILLLQGTADPTTPQVLRYLAFLPHARLRWIPGGNHVVISDAPDAAARSIRWSSCTPSTPSTQSGPAPDNPERPAAGTDPPLYRRRPPAGARRGVPGSPVEPVGRDERAAR